MKDVKRKNWKLYRYIRSFCPFEWIFCVVGWTKLYQLKTCCYKSFMFYAQFRTNLFKIILEVKNVCIFNVYLQNLIMVHSLKLAELKPVFFPEPYWVSMNELCIGGSPKLYRHNDNCAQQSNVSNHPSDIHPPFHSCKHFQRAKDKKFGWKCLPSWNEDLPMALKRAFSASQMKTTCRIYTHTRIQIQ